MKKLLCCLCAFGMLSGCSSSAKDLLSNPKDADVKAAIETIDGVKSTCMVTEDNDPNGQLNKDGGYTGAVYFRLTTVDENLAKEEYTTPYVDDACEAGTVGGGQIEIYATEADAEKRNDYLANFDGGPIGDAHILKGTLVIRISNDLTATQQKELEDKIVAKLSEEQK